MLIDEVSERVANRLGISKEQVIRINRIQWKFLLDTIQSGEFKPVHLIYLGKFIKNKKYNESGKRNSKWDHQLNLQERRSGGTSTTEG